MMTMQRSIDAITMEELPERLVATSRPIVLDVRSRAEFALGHVPEAINVPVAEIARRPRAIAAALPPHDRLFVHCTKGVRADRAVEALRGAGLEEVVLVRDSGLPEWKKSGQPVERGFGRSLARGDHRHLFRAVVVAVGAGAVATLASGIANGGLSLLVSDRQKGRERRIRRGSPHEVGGSLLLERALGHRPPLFARLVATVGFNVFYSAMWGLLYAATRRAIPRSATAPVLPLTAAAFFVACDGVVAPALGVTPGLPRVPWQLNAKELVNHLVWNATAEVVHRADERAAERSET